MPTPPRKHAMATVAMTQIDMADELPAPAVATGGGEGAAVTVAPP